MRSILRFGAALAFAGFGACAFAQTPLPRIIRGAIVSVDGPNVVVRTRAGESVHLRLKDGQEITAVVPAALTDVKPGVFVGVAAMPAGDGALKAMEVHIFPEAQRGTGEGFRPFDLAPGSSMTNANISAMIDTVSGPKLTLTYKGGEQTIIVDKSTPIVTFAPGEAGDLKPGADIDLFRPTAASDGAVEAVRVLVGRNGTKVPM
jgi:hypothetical protein